MSLNHPLAPKVAPSCRRYPHQSAALFQTFVDLSLAQQWRDVEVLDLDECGCAVIRGLPREPKRSPPAVVLPMGLTVPTSLEALDKVFQAVSRRFPSPSSSSDKPASPSDSSSDQPEHPTTIYLSMIEKDSSIVYYVLRQGIVSPKEVPE
ncbi:hypothetical protein NBRC10512_002756 [Rhodotorula toruloides]|uniref:RHTO0S11e05182g1_1 n=2 Tax=Rhodotorula toruloides TaxID=5286 RepID=A0A061BD66_RHOTO|nr:uncharacterized protein RHTO_01635 [Rhodotorula toruloides NP11]EMS21575.1 hypothetical protein RHTO_01635 [Rhodotorula toruloides NP11]CDR45816.1 RHTO0S11e05182g1_1 [Rhodotorula toruloides]